MTRTVVLPAQPHCFAFGGFELQMLNALAAARGAGADVTPLDVWSRDGDFDVLHVWGCNPAHLGAVRWAREAGKAVVMTALLPYDTMLRRVTHRLSVVGSRKESRELLQLVDVLSVTNEMQADAAASLFGFDRARAVVIPNVIAEPFFEPQQMGRPEEFVLCVGNICERKNQVRLAEACLQLGRPLTIVGDPLTGQESYAKHLRQLVGSNHAIRWLPSMPPASPELVQLFRTCRMFALPSLAETQPISLLEAAACRKPLLTSKADFADQSFYRNARLVNPSSVSDIRHGLEDVLAAPERFTPPNEPLQRCRSGQIGAAYAQAYEMARQARIAPTA